MALTKTEVSELYVILFNRASEKSGNQNWVNSGYNTVATMADAMLDTDAANEYYDSLKIVSNEDFVEYIYDKALNKGGATVDPDGKAGWVKFLETGASRGEMIEKMIEAIKEYQVGGAKYATADQATKDAAKQFANKVIVSDYTAENLENIDVSEIGSTVSFDVLNVTYDTTTIDAAKDKVDALKKPADGETGMLTTSIKAVADAETAKSDWIESLGKIDQDLDADTKPVDASEPHINTLLDNAATNIDSAVNTTLSATDYKDLKKTALQDADISTALSITQSKLDFATSAAKTGMTTLVNNANAALETYNDADKAQAKAATDYSAEVQAFLTANKAAIEKAGATQLATNITTVTDIVFLTDATFNTNTDYSSKLLVIGDTIYKGTTKGALTAAKAQASQTFSDLVRDTNLTAANTALKTATATETNALEALEEAVGKVYVLETGGHSLADIGSAVTAAGGTGNGSINFKDTSVKVYKTAADTAKGVGKTSTVVTFVDDDAVVDGNTVTVTFDGVTKVFTVADATAITGAQIVTALLAEGVEFDNFTAKAVTGQPTKIEFIYNDIAKNDDSTVTAGDFTIVDHDSNALTLASAAGATQVEPGDKTELSSAASKADDLNTAINNLDALEKAIADFQAARELKVALEEKNDAIKAAKAAITNATDDKDAPGLAMNLRDLDQNATTSDDVFVFSKDAADGTIANFGKSGDDYFFFGQNYSLIALPKDKTIFDNVGNVSALEIIWEQDGNDLKLYVETESFAGNASSTADIVTITLTGVNAEDVSFSDGMLTIA